MDKSDIDNYAYFQEVWTSPKRYALVKNEFRDGYAIVDVINKLFVLIEDEDIKRFVQQKLQCRINTTGTFQPVFLHESGTIDGSDDTLSRDSTQQRGLILGQHPV